MEEKDHSLGPRQKGMCASSTGEKRRKAARGWLSHIQVRKVLRQDFCKEMLCGWKLPLGILCASSEGSSHAVSMGSDPDSDLLFRSAVRARTKLALGMVGPCLASE